MLSRDELKNGRPFILKLWDSTGASSHWVQTLKDDSARHWYDIYRRSDWGALRAEGREIDAAPLSNSDRANKVKRVECLHNRGHRSRCRLNDRFRQADSFDGCFDLCEPLHGFGNLFIVE